MRPSSEVKGDDQVPSVDGITGADVGVHQASAVMRQ
jgi:hypothetical protein